MEREGKRGGEGGDREVEREGTERWRGRGQRGGEGGVREVEREGSERWRGRGQRGGEGGVREVEREGSERWRGRGQRGLFHAWSSPLTSLMILISIQLLLESCIILKRVGAREI